MNKKFPDAKLGTKKMRRKKFSVAGEFWRVERRVEPFLESFWRVEPKFWRVLESCRRVGGELS